VILHTDRSQVQIFSNLFVRGTGAKIPKQLLFPLGQEFGEGHGIRLLDEHVLLHGSRIITIPLPQLLNGFLELLNGLRVFVHKTKQPGHENPVQSVFVGSPGHAEYSQSGILLEHAVGEIQSTPIGQLNIQDGDFRIVLLESLPPGRDALAGFQQFELVGEATADQIDPQLLVLYDNRL